MTNYYMVDNAIYTEYELSHAGVKGMKWGVRRRRGSHAKLTTSGRKRLNKLVASSGQSKSGNTPNNKKNTNTSTKTKIKVSKTKRGAKVVVKNKDMKMKIIANSANVAAGAMRVAAAFVPGAGALSGVATVASLVSTVAALK